MSDRGTLDFIAASLTQVQKNLKAANDAAAFQIAELTQEIADSGSAEAIRSLTKAVEALKMPDVQFTAPAFSPTINVPAPAALPPVNLSDASVRALTDALSGLQINVEAEMPQGAAPTTVFNAPRIAKWEVRIPGQYGAPDRTMTLTPTYAKD